MEVLNTLDSESAYNFHIDRTWYVAGTEPNFPLNAPQPNLPGHVVAICTSDTSHCIDIHVTRHEKTSLSSVKGVGKGV